MSSENDANIKIGNSYVEEREERLGIVRNSRVEERPPESEDGRNYNLVLEEGVNYVHRFAPATSKGNETLTAVYEAMRQEAEMLSDEATLVADNTHVNLTNLRGVRLWERVLDLPSDASLELSARQSLVMLKRLFSPPFTRHNIERILDSVWGPREYVFEIYPHKFETVIDIHTNQPELYLKFEQYVRELFPANLFLTISIQFVHLYLARHHTYGSLSGMTHAELGYYAR